MGSEYEKDDRRHHSSSIPGRHRRHADTGSGVRDVSDLPGLREARSELPRFQSVRQEGFEKGEEGEALASLPDRLRWVKKPGRNRAATKEFSELAVETCATSRGV